MEVSAVDEKVALWMKWRRQGAWASGIGLVLLILGGLVAAIPVAPFTSILYPLLGFLFVFMGIISLIAGTASYLVYDRNLKAAAMVLGEQRVADQR